MTINELHRQAMNQAEMAFMAKLKGDMEYSRELTRQAFDNERKAAELLTRNFEDEPTRSVLHRSAASLALDCGEYRAAERLIAAALFGNPPDEIAEELRDLLEQVYFQRHLELRGISLSPNEVQMSISGEEVGFGMANSDEFLKRVSNTETLIYRTAERKLGRPFRERGRIINAISKEFQLFLSVPRAASFAVSMKIGGTIDQLNLFSNEVIDELLSCFDLFNSKKDDDIKKKIPDEAYYANFIGLAKQIAPDGKRVKVVGFTASMEGAEKKVALTLPQMKVPIVEVPSLPEEKNKRVTAKGQLRYADSTSSKGGEIKLIEEDGTKHDIIVPAGMMSDIVKPLWEDIVIVTGSIVRRKILLEDINKAEEE
jgi:hypothetical protein